MDTRPPSPAPQLRASRRGLAGTWGVLALVQLALLLFFTSRFVFESGSGCVWAVSDDIYISACYARNLAEGHGPVWYPGAQPVEGFSNPLWTALLALLHALPFFREPQLGLHLLVVQGCLLVLAFLLAFRVLARLLELAGGARAPGAIQLFLVGVLSLGWSSLAFWQAEGFEIELVLVLGLWSLLLALEVRTSARRALWIGCLTGLALATRLDGVLACTPAAVLLVCERRWRWAHVCACSAGFLVVAGVAFGARRLLFGEWLPNTYWLKLSGWPLGERLALGWRGSQALMPTLVLAWIGFGLPRVRRALGAARLAVAALLSTFTLGVAYSIHNGGDAWFLRLGYDRFSAPGGLFLGLALCVAVLRLGATRLELGLTGLVAVVIALSPVLLDPSRGYVLGLATGKFVRSEQELVETGRAYQACSRPGARIALGAAGAIVYFSHRGACDFLGKCDPWVAHQPVNRLDMTSGHNKRYESAIFERDAPDFARGRPPAPYTPLYVECEREGQRLWARRDSQYVRWDELRIVAP